MSIDLPELTPPPRGQAKAVLRRPIPCAGLFGWRKHQAPPGEERPTEKRPEPNYPAD